jgi:ATP-dependent helicase/nuclease subunit A
LSLLQFLVNPHDNRNTVELLRSPWFRVSDQTLIESVHRSGRSTWAKINEDNLCLREPAIGLLRSLARLAASEVGVTAAFRRGLIQSGLIDLAHQHDASGRREANLWKLLARLDQEERASGFNAISFVHRCLADIDMNEGSSEGDAVAAIEPDRINLMTVHASKGLEFKHVILPRIGRKASTIRSKKLVYLEDEKIWSVRVTNPESDESSSGLLERVWRDRQTRAEAEESERVFYVAATRAAETLYMSWVDEPDKTSWAQLLRLDLSPGSHKLEKFTYEVQHTPVAPNASHASAASVEEAVLRDGVRAPWRPMHVSSASGTSRASTSVSVTSILDAEAIDKNDQSDKGEAKSNALLIERLQTANRGTQVHRLMELMKYPSRSRIEQLVKKWFPENENEVVAAIEYVQTLKQPNLAAIIENGEVEWGFAFDQNGSVIEGQIDLWGRDSNGKAWIIDYKTGSSRHREKAFQQMSIYAFALYRSGLVAASESISLAAVYPFDRDAYVKMSPPFLDLERQFKNYFLGVSG